MGLPGGGHSENILVGVWEGFTRGWYGTVALKSATITFY